MKSLIMKPRISEKAYASSQALRSYVFDLPEGANKPMVRKAVESQYGVTVTGVRIAIVKGKTKRFIVNGRAKFGSRSDVKKAYVTLKDGDALPLFAGVSSESKEDVKQDDKSSKRDAKVQKMAKK